jgi:hypothetical protein
MFQFQSSLANEMGTFLLGKTKKEGVDKPSTDKTKRQQEARCAWRFSFRLRSTAPLNRVSKVELTFFLAPIRPASPGTLSLRSVQGGADLVVVERGIRR